MNVSAAVVAQRHSAASDLDFWPTKPWATRALFEVCLPRLAAAAPALSVWDPACGKGDMADVLKDYFRTVICSDIADYQVYAEVADFLWPQTRYECDWIIANPPFKAAPQFIAKALEVARDGVAMFLRLGILETIDRYNGLWSQHPPSAVFVLTERVSLVPGRLDPTASLPHQYVWAVWGFDLDVPPLPRPFGCELVGVPLFWIPPCRGQLERRGDYDRYANDAPPDGGLFGGDYD